jgi:hypothetical protein
MADVPPFGESDPFWTVYAWKRDSETLRRLRAGLAEIARLAETPCEGKGSGDCLTCWPCRLRAIWAGLR